MNKMLTFITSLALAIIATSCGRDVKDPPKKEFIEIESANNDVTRTPLSNEPSDRKQTRPSPAPIEGGEVASESVGPTIEIKISSVKLAKGGDICLAVFNQEAGFPFNKDGTIFTECFEVAVAIKGIEVELPSVGTYAFSVFHDADQNGKLEQTAPIGEFPGIPKEGFGFSNNPELKIGAASFNETAIDVGLADRDPITIQMNYLLED